MNTALRSVLVAVLMAVSIGAAASVDDGVAAFYVGEYKKAVELLEPHTDDGRAQRFLALIYDKNYHVLWDFVAVERNGPVYSGGVEFDEEAMLRHYQRVIELGDIIGRWHYCEWTRSVFAKNRRHLKGSRCKNAELYRVMRKYGNENAGDPYVEFYNWMIRSGQLGTGDRRIRSRKRLLPGAWAGDHVAQSQLARVYFGFNVRRDRAPDHTNAFLWYTAAAMGGNLRAKYMKAYLRKLLEKNGKYECVETYTLAMLNNIIAKQNGQPAPNDVTEATQACNDQVLAVD